MTILTYVRTAMHKRAQYRRTRHEIETMPLDVTLDLGIFREDAKEIATRAVYG